MSLHKIYYNYIHEQNPDFSPFCLDDVSFDIKQEPIDTSSPYNTCPVWKHRTNRVFTVRSPFDFHLKITKDNVFSDTHTQDQLRQLIMLAPGYVTENRIIVQMMLPRILFWTKSKNIWIEASNHPSSSSDNNYTLMEGWFNLSNWTRPLAFGFQFHDLNKDVSFKRGDPLFNVRFFSNNLDDGYKLIRQEPPQNILSQSRRRSSIKDYFSPIPSDILNNLFKNKQKSKCPFNFLWSDK